MKRIVLFVQFIFLAAVAYSQVWAPIGATWYYDAMDSGAAPYHSEYFFFRAEKDTSFANHNSVKISRTHFQYSGNVSTLSPLFIYQSGDTVFYYNETFKKYVVLYNFNVSEGDTLFLYSPDTTSYASHDSIFRVVVDSIGLVQVQSEILKWIYTVPLDGFSYWLPYVEKIGCQFLMLPQPWVIFPEWDGPLRCYEDSVIFYSDFPLPCDYRLTNSVSELPSQVFDLFPNPTSNQLQLRTNSQQQFYIKNVFGQICLEGKTLQEETIIDVSSLHNGSYFLFLYAERGIVSRKFVKQD